MALQLNPLHRLGQGLEQCIIAAGPNGGLWDYALGNHPLASPNAPPVVDYGGFKAWEYTGGQAINLDSYAMRNFGIPPRSYAIMFRTVQTTSTVLWGGWLGYNPYWGQAAFVNRYYAQASFYIHPALENQWAIAPQSPVNDGQVHIFVGGFNSARTHMHMTCPSVPPSGDVQNTYGTTLFTDDAPQVDTSRAIGFAWPTGGDDATYGHIFGVWVWNWALTTQDWEDMATNPFQMFMDDTPPPVTAAVINVAIMA